MFEKFELEKDIQVVLVLNIIYIIVFLFNNVPEADNTGYSRLGLYLLGTLIVPLLARCLEN